MTALQRSTTNAVEELDEVIGKLLDSMLDIDENERELLVVESLKILRMLQNDLSFEVPA